MGLVLKRFLLSNIKKRATAIRRHRKLKDIRKMLAFAATHDDCNLSLQRKIAFVICRGNVCRRRNSAHITLYCVSFFAFRILWQCLDSIDPRNTPAAALSINSALKSRTAAADTRSALRQLHCNFTLLSAILVPTSLLKLALEKLDCKTLQSICASKYRPTSPSSH